jgi:predicted membrane channel-forming protein YqfA (hemolysin III family)
VKALFKGDGYRKRGMIYIAIATAGILYELLFVNPVRPIPILLWLGLIGLSIIIILTLKDSTVDRHRT